METRQATRSSLQVGWPFWLKWVLANALTLAITVEASAYLYPVVNAVLGTTLERTAVATTVSVLSVLSGILIALLAGMLQWLVLRRHVRWANQWWLATSIGWIVGGFLAPYAAFAILGASPAALSFNGVILAMTMAVAGIFQWLVLRRHVRRAGWWVLASIAGPVIGESLGPYAGLYVALYAGGIVAGLGRDLAGVVFSASLTAVIGAIVGSITGIALVWLLRHSQMETV